MARILLIDDEQMVRETLIRLLEQGGHEVASAENGERGLQLAREGDYELVVTDINMPGVDGLATIDGLSAALGHQRIIAISGGSRDVHASDCLEMAQDAGAKLVLQKPFTSQQLLDAVEKLQVG